MEPYENEFKDFNKALRDLVLETKPPTPAFDPSIPEKLKNKGNEAVYRELNKLYWVHALSWISGIIQNIEKMQKSRLDRGPGAVPIGVLLEELKRVTDLLYGWL